MRNVKDKILTVILLLSLGLLSSCNGNSGGSSAIAGEQFSISLIDLDIRRVSNGDAVAVDLSGMTSNEMTLDQ